MKKQILAAAIVAMLGLTACDEAEKSEKSSEKATEATTAAEVTTEAATVEATTEAATEAAVPTELSDKYADLDNRSFKYNGKMFTLGVSTLQDFLDAGAELEPEKSTSADANYDKHFKEFFVGQYPYGSAEYRLKTENYQEIYLYFINPNSSQENKQDNDILLRECTLGKIHVKKAGDGTVIPDNFEFAFDNSLTADSLIANSGEPTYQEYSSDYNYMVVSDKFTSFDSGYMFSIVNDSLSSFIISWIP